MQRARDGSGCLLAFSIWSEYLPPSSFPFFGLACFAAREAFFFFWLSSLGMLLFVAPAD